MCSDFCILFLFNIQNFCKKKCKSSPLLEFNVEYYYSAPPPPGRAGSKCLSPPPLELGQGELHSLMISFENSFILKVNSKALYSSVPGCPCSTTTATYNYTSPQWVKHYHFYAYIRNLTYNNSYHNIMKCAPKTIVS